MPYSTADLQQLFDPDTLTQGRKLIQASRVQSLDIRNGGSLVTAVVASDKKDQSFRIFVRIHAGSAPNRIHAECSCRQSSPCEHSAAALLLALERQNPPSDPSSLSPQTGGAEKIRAATPPSDQVLLYVLKPEENIDYGHISFGLTVDTVVARKLRHGGYSGGNHYSPERVNKHNPARFLQAEDLEILPFLAQQLPSPTITPQADASRLFKVIVRTGRCHGWDIDSLPLSMSATRRLTLDWRVDQTGTQHLQWQVSPNAGYLLMLPEPWFIDREKNQCGKLTCDLPQPLLGELLTQPTLSPRQAAQFKNRIAREFPAVRLPQLKTFEVKSIVQAEPVACLRLYSITPNADSNLTTTVHCASLFFDYDGICVTLGTPPEYFDGKALIHVQRNTHFEQRCKQRLSRTGFSAIRKKISSHEDLYSLSTEPEAWVDFQYDVLPVLEQEHWRVIYDPTFQLRAVRGQKWYYDTRRGEDKDWFELTIGVYIDGRQVNILPVILEFIKNYPPGTPWEFGGDHCVLQIPGQQFATQQWIRVEAERFRGIVNTLVSLYSKSHKSPPQSLQLPLYHLVKISELVLGDSAPSADWCGDRDLQRLGDYLRHIDRVPSVEVPPALKASLRPYQQEGLNWLQLLREHQLAGILADDMGLGKTVQTLANLLVEKQQQRMRYPSLIVAPTSLVFNWRSEARRFAPSLSVLCQHGAKRQRFFTELEKYDIVITSYSLLVRDESILLSRQFHYLILDEAHYIKNPKTQAARCVRKINARHKLCLSGTPLENHLGELWSLFDFLLPDYLGNLTQFKTLFRTPIEKQGDNLCLQALTSRVRPFMLRRTKDAVARELPPKTEIIHRIPLTQHQQDLYETVRLSVHHFVRSAIEREGLARSQITILDALLKLRQVCCDPRLVKLETPLNAKDSAKLLALTEMLPEMIEEGRRILLFSQFTSMLALIENQVQKLGIDYAKLTGQTVDRAAQVARFQSGDVPLFLISLKAGGVGLNLTAADTVIHYDPWWNPAVEQQATDRAHRIGQTQPVFVYKLICEGTVEEKIIALQQHKKDLADGLFQAQNKQSPPLSEEDIDQLLAPLE